MSEAKLFDRLTDGQFAEYECEERISEILGVKLLGIGWDDYDASFEIYPWEGVADVLPTQEQHAQILALGCLRYWINFPDGTQRYGTGERTVGTSPRWQAHNRYKDVKRSQEALMQELYEALKSYIEADEVADGHGYGVGGEAMAKARAALSKVEGSQGENKT